MSGAPLPHGLTIAVAICTHNPAPATWERVVAAIAGQTAPRDRFHVVVVDNASEPPLGEERIAALRAAGIESRILREPRPGLSRARLAAIAATRDPWILFVDDDNELEAGYVAASLAFIAGNPDIGCFGGRLLLPPALEPAAWVEPFLPYLGIRDPGEAVIRNQVDAWGLWEPPGAGAVVERSVLDEYVRRAETDPLFFALGRSGRFGLASCDDSLLMRGAVRVGKASAYVPALKLWHHLHPKRFRFGYLMNLMFGYGRSFVRLDRILYGDIPTPREYRSLPATLRQMKRTFRRHANFASKPYRLGAALIDLGRHVELRRRPDGGSPG